ncbi:MAG TPA: glycosyltransferase [Gemmatimonadaceae bacterium]|nr:glycosyltransferase [Gemmatimonadaceae bacterium]
MSRPLVTVIVPVYNGARYLRESLDSIVSQTYQPLEIIVLDDASTDETPSIIASFGDRVRHVRHPSNLGQFRNINAGLRLATGEFVSIYHADDVYEPSIVERSAEFLESHSDVGAVFSLDVFIDAHGREYGRLALPPEVRGKSVLSFGDVVNALLLRKNRFLRTPGAMARRAVYESVGDYLDTYGIAGDFEMWLRIARRYPLGLLDEHLFRYRHFHGNLSHHYQYLRTSPDTFFALMDKYLSEGAAEVATATSLAAYEGHRAEEVLMNAVNHYIRGDVRSARRLVDSVSARTLLSASTIQGRRLVVFRAMLRALTRVPRLAFVSEIMQRRWNRQRPPVGA